MTTLLSTSHPEIIAFYETHSLDFESMNLIFVDVLKKVLSHMDGSLNQTLANHLLNNFSILKNKVESMTMLLDSKMSEYRKDYIQDIKLILTSNNVEQIAPLIRDTNNSLLEKTSSFMNEIIPKNKENVSKEIQYHFQELQKSLSYETSKLVSSSLDKNGVEGILQNIVNTIFQANQNLMTVVSSSETRIENKLVETNKNITEVKDIVRENEISPLRKDITEVLNKFDFGIGKGTMSEHLLFNILVNYYNTADIEYVAGKKESGDILFQQQNKPKILIENKDHESNNVPKPDVAKFIRDCDIQNCCGILFAQHRGITNKKDFELQINNGNVLLYVHNVKFNIEKISMAIDIVESFKMKMDELGISNSDHVIDKDLMNEINQEYIYFVNQKESLLKISKDMHDKMLEKISELKLPNLNQFLSKRFAFSTNQNANVCQYCKEPVKKSVKQHYRHCQVKKEMEKNKTFLVSPEEPDEDE